MFRRFLIAAFCCAVTAGCATMPTQSVDHISLAGVEERVKCEIGEAYRELHTREGYPDLDLWAAGITLTLSTDSTGGIAPASSLTGPFGSVSPLDLNFGASLNAKRTALLNVYIAFQEAAKHQCPPTPQSLLENHMGLAEWIVRVFEAQHIVDERSTVQSSFEKDKSIGYSLEFLLTLSGGVTPNFIIANTTGTKFGLTAEAKATNSADIAMAKLAESDFRQRFKIIVRKDPDKTIPNPAYEKLSKDMQTLSNLPKTITIPGARHKVQVPDGVEARLGPDTKDKLDQVLHQINDKVLIQTLRR
jgi:hypothetical protein